MSSKETGRPIIDKDLLLSPLPGDSPMGQWLRYDPIYDNIRQARSEETPWLSQGIWKREIKRADWAAVESLCYTCLTTRTKDLQILGWLAESWIVLDGLDGFKQGIRIITEMAQRHWSALFPYPEEPENRQVLFDWMDEVFTSHMVFFAVTVPEDGVNQPWTLATWRYAQRQDHLSRQSAEAKKEIELLNSTGGATLATFGTSITQTSGNYFEEAIVALQETRADLGALRSFLDQQWGAQSPAFIQLRETFDDFEHIWRRALKAKEEQPQPKRAADISPAEADPGTNIPQRSSNRSSLYQQLGTIAQELLLLEPQSPTPHVLRKLAQWENKSFPEIIDSLSADRGDAAVVLRVLTQDIVQRERG